MTLFNLIQSCTPLIRSSPGSSCTPLVRAGGRAQFTPPIGVVRTKATKATSAGCTPTIGPRSNLIGCTLALNLPSPATREAVQARSKSTLTECTPLIRAESKPRLTGCTPLIRAATRLPRTMCCTPVIRSGLFQIDRYTQANYGCFPCTPILN